MTKQRISGVIRVQVPVRVKDLSLSGAHLVLKTPVEVGSVHEFMLDLGGAPFLATARVVRSRPLESGTGHDIAVEFTSVDARDQARLASYIERTRPRSLP